ncbi:MAG: DUF898 domain-containing protein [Candidatus Nitronauta litoralis]|uniref:DUF898 domain-containing protein n=1 Tax=Candidatus Nitronauta litoralis TaxID=2705533 RepID=A0A7T0BWS9_9BACT|nr:MAG: DUF898 domain-containing protein [Candidatus Nitronauta litoralis]
MFRLTPDEARQVLRQVENGQQWKFGHPVSKKQADTAVSYLNSLGFQVRRVSDGSPVKLAAPQKHFPASDEELEVEEEVEAEERRVSRLTDTLEFFFKGDALDLMVLYLKLWVFSLLTLGLYSFWGRTELRRYLLSHLSLGGEPFHYRGTPKGLAATNVKALLVIILAFFFLVWLHRTDPLSSPVFEKLFFGAGLFGLFYLFWRGIGYRLSQTEWQNLKFDFKGTFGHWFGLQIKGWLLFVLSLGLTGPVFWSQAWKYKMEQTTFGGRAFRYTGNWRNLARPWYIGWGVTAVTLGWGAPVWFWSVCEIKKVLWNRTHFDPGRFEFSADGKSSVRLQIENWMILILSLGLGYPSVKKRNLDFTTRHLALVDIKKWNHLLEEIRKDVTRKSRQTFQNFKTP